MATKTKSKTILKPLDDRVIIRPTEAEERTDSGIYLPDSARDKPQTGTVTADLPGKLNDDDERTPLAVSVGDTIVYGKYGGTEIEVDGETVVILREGELLAKLD